MGFFGWVRRLTPLFLLALAALAWFEQYLPGHEALVKSFGSTTVLRFVVGLACVFACIQVLEQRRLEFLFKQMLEQLRGFRDQQVARSDDPGAREDAVRILVSALESADEHVRKTAREHLTRLCGKDLGAEPAAWAKWVREEFGKN